ncbi:MAG: hypothetical protein AAF748_15335 [Pseudomonadota bacterium]
MSQQGGRNKSDWEHSRYTGWRPSYRQDGEAIRSGATYNPHGRRRRVYRSSLIGRILRFVFAVALFVALIGPGFDFANGLAKAAPGTCTIRTVIDGGRVLVSCPGGDVVEERAIAGYIAPRLINASCFGETMSGLAASVDLRRALFSADVVRISTTGEVVAPAPAVVPAPAQPDGDGETTADTEGDGEAGGATVPGTEETNAVPLDDSDDTVTFAESGDAIPFAETVEAPSEEDTPEPTPEPSAVAIGEVQVLLDGVDVAQLMQETGRVISLTDAAAGEGWCE